MQTRERWHGSLCGLTLMLCVAWGADAQQVRPQRVEPLRADTPVNADRPVPRQGNQSRVVESPDALLIGIPEARRRLGQDLPTGKGVVVGHVEGNPGQYTPSVEKPRYQNIHFIARSGASEPFAHAEAVAGKLYGQGGLAPGIREVHSFTGGDWLGAGFLNAGQGVGPRLDERPRLYNHSWISSLEGRAGEEVLRRIDYVIDTADVLMCVGVNNGRGSAVPPLLGSAYNVIAVGALSGNSSGGYTHIEGVGRCKPDVVAPGGLTSFATPVAAAVVARLIEAADRLAPPPAKPGETTENPEAAETTQDPPSFAANNPAARSEVIKAVLMAGTVKPEGWAPESGKPLDAHLGAGMVHFDRSLRVLEAGHTGPGPIRTLTGWSFEPITTQGIVTYTLDVRSPLGPASIALVWNRRIDGRTVMAMPQGASTPVKGWVHTPRLADLDLRVLKVNDDGSLRILAQSVSRVDNVEYLHLPTLEPGEYRLEVTRPLEDAPDPAWDFALAWHLALAEEQPQPDAQGNTEASEDATNPAPEPRP